MPEPLPTPVAPAAMGTSQTVGVNLGVSFKATDFMNISGGVSVSQTVSSSVAHTDGRSESVTRSITAPVIVPPKKVIATQLRVYKQFAQIPFVANSVADAPLSANDKGLLRLADIARLDARTFVIEGIININGASAGEVFHFELPFDEDRCKGKSGVVRFNPTAADAKEILQQLLDLKQ